MCSFGNRKRNARLHATALELAKQLGPIQFESSGDSCTPLDLVKHLTSDYLRSKLKIEPSVWLKSWTRRNKKNQCWHSFCWNNIQQKIYILDCFLPYLIIMNNSNKNNEAPILIPKDSYVEGYIKSIKSIRLECAFHGTILTKTRWLLTRRHRLLVILFVKTWCFSVEWREMCFVRGGLPWMKGHLLMVKFMPLPLRV